MILHVANLGNPVLRQIATVVKPETIMEPIFQAFLDNLMESMDFHDGVGLAAPQVFLSTRVIAVRIPADMDDTGKGMSPTVYINPELTIESEDLVDGWEGCLSLKDLRGIVPRHKRIRLRALDRNAKPIDLSLEGFAARVFQHEVDHLDGIVFTDRMTDMKSLMFLDEMDRYGPPGSD